MLPRAARLVAAVGMLTLGVALLATACGGGDGTAARPTTGRGIYAAYCLTCHGADGQGGVGPQLAGVVAGKYPNIDDQIALVTNGRASMPAFGGTLSAAEIRKVVTYERTDLGQ